jgi:hypothetical protein
MPIKTEKSAAIPKLISFFRLCGAESFEPVHQQTIRRTKQRMDMPI